MAALALRPIFSSALEATSIAGVMVLITPARAGLVAVVAMSFMGNLKTKRNYLQRMYANAQNCCEQATTMNRAQGNNQTDGCHGAINSRQPDCFYGEICDENQIWNACFEYRAGRRFYRFW